MNETSVDGRVISSAIIIDDDEIDQHLNQRIIRKSALVENLDTFRSAEDALQHLKQRDTPVDVIFLDINMPRMNGFDFLDHAIKELGSRFAQIIVIMLTSSFDPDDKQRAASYEVVKRYESKPLSKEILHRVSLLLDSPAGT